MLGPATERFCKALLTEGRDYVSNNPHLFPLAFTLNVEELRRGFFDPEGDLRRAARGLAMHNEGTIRRVAPVHGLDMLSMHETFGFLTPTGNEDVSSYLPNGAIGIDALKVKTRMDSMVGRNLGVSDSTGDAIYCAGTEDFVEEVSALDAVSMVKRHLASQAAASDAGSVRGVVLRHFEALAARHVTFRELEGTTGISRSTLSDAFLAIRADLARAFPDLHFS